MSREEIDDLRFGDKLHEQLPEPEFDPAHFAGYRSPVLMRVMLVIINLAALVFCRSFIQSWFSVHGTTPVWIPILFMLVPLGSLFFVYYYLGRIGREIILKLICLACCALQAVNFFSPVATSQVSLGKDGFSYDFSYVSSAGADMGISFPECVTATTVDGTHAVSEYNGFSDRVKSFFTGEKLYYCTDVIYKPEQVAEFEKYLEKNPLWLDEISEKLHKLSVYGFSADNYDRFLFYDCESKSFNTVPESDRHTIYQVMYNSQRHEMRILKYSKNF